MRSQTIKLYREKVDLHNTLNKLCTVTASNGGVRNLVPFDQIKLLHPEQLPQIDIWQEGSKHKA